MLIQKRERFTRSINHNCRVPTRGKTSVIYETCWRQERRCNDTYRTWTNDKNVDILRKKVDLRTLAKTDEARRLERKSNGKVEWTIKAVEKAQVAAGV
jgi:hypothetical protein